MAYFATVSLDIWGVLRGPGLCHCRQRDYDEDDDEGTEFDENLRRSRGPALSLELVEEGSFERTRAHSAVRKRTASAANGFAKGEEI